jgi:small conductance mechanosensitive channel
METGVAFIDIYLIPWSIRILIALGVLIIGNWIAGRITRLVQGLLMRARLEQTLVRFLTNLTQTILLVASALTAVQTLGVSIASLLAIIGAAGLAIGLALKDSLSNFAAGVMIIMFRPYRVSDAITAAGQSGSVEEIGMFSTLLNTADNQRIIVPNSAILNGTIVNYSTMPTRRLDLIVTIGINEEIAPAIKVIQDVLKAEANILEQPGASWGVDRISDKGIDLYVRPWVKNSDYWGVRTLLLEHLNIAFNEAGIESPPRPPAAVILQTAQVTP